VTSLASTRAGTCTSTTREQADLRVDEALLPRYLTEVGGEHHNLFAFPAQSNFSGVQHPLEWIEQAHEHGWDVLLDAAAFVPTNRLDLSHWHPDFVALSFYKMFGWPTGVGCLLARRDALTRLERPWFSRAGTRPRCEPAASATRVPAKSHSRSRGRRWSAASSAPA